MSEKLSVIILAAGKGTRMKSDLHKVLHPIAGKAMVHHLMESVEPLNPDHITVVIGDKADQLEAALDGVSFAYQHDQKGTGHAVMMAEDALNSGASDILVLYGDVPFIPTAIMQEMIDMRRKSGAAASVLGFTPKDAGKYGRLKLDDSGNLAKIIEYKDANDAERAITLCNSGMMAFDGATLKDMLSKLDDNNAAGEYYLTDLVEVARTAGRSVTITEASEEDVMGVNSRRDLALPEATFQDKKRGEMMDAGVTLIDPSTVYFSADTEIAPDVTIEPNVFIGPGVKVGKGSVIRANSHLEGAIVGEDVQVGPFARLRPGTELSDGAKVGNFVETKKAKVGKGSKINHLSYVGDAVLGENVNVGAGTITCNYDGFNKAQTIMGDGSFIGSNTALVAPVNVGAGAIVAAGSTITKDVDADSLGIERASQKQMAGWAPKFRKSAKQKKEQAKKG